MKRSLLAATALSTSVMFLVPGAVLAQSYDWTGFYAGIALGGGQTGSTLQFDYSGTSVTLPTGPLPFTGGGSSMGAVAGYNWQAGTIVVGVEADAKSLAFTGTLSGGTSPNDYSADERITALLSLRGRLGYAADRFLVYGTAGLATGQASVTADAGKGTPPTGTTSAQGQVTGTVVGAGIEYALNDNLSVKVQGSVYNLSQLSAVGDAGKGFPNPADPYTANYTPRPMVFEAGFNVHF